MRLLADTATGCYILLMAQQKTGQIKGYPEFGELDGKRVRLTWENLRKLTPRQKSELIVEVEGTKIRPWRFASQGSDYKFD